MSGHAMCHQAHLVSWANILYDVAGGKWWWCREIIPLSVLLLSSVRIRGVVWGSRRQCGWIGECWMERVTDGLGQHNSY